MIALHIYVCLFSPAAAEGEIDRENTRFGYFNANFLCKRIHLMWIIFAKTSVILLAIKSYDVNKLCKTIHMLFYNLQVLFWLPKGSLGTSTVDKSTPITQLYVFMTDFSLGNVNNFR